MPTSGSMKKLRAVLIHSTANTSSAYHLTCLW